MIPSTHVRIHRADKDRLTELAARMGIPVADVIHHLLRAIHQQGPLAEKVDRLEKNLQEETDRLDNCIYRDRQDMQDIKQWIGSISARLTNVEERLGIKAERQLREGELPAGMFCKGRPPGRRRTP